jgi:hypothetical protein
MSKNSGELIFRIAPTENLGSVSWNGVTAVSPYTYPHLLWSWKLIGKGITMIGYIAVAKLYVGERGRDLRYLIIFTTIIKAPVQTHITNL